MQGPSLATLRILWGAFLASQGLYVYVVVGHVIEPSGEPPQPIMLTALSAVAMVVGAASIFLPRFLYAQALRALTEHDLGALRESREMLSRRAIQLGMTPFIVGIALNEAVAIFGLILGVLGFAVVSVLPFFAAAAVLMLVRFPIEGTFTRPLEERLSGVRAG